MSFLHKVGSLFSVGRKNQKKPQKAVHKSFVFPTNRDGALLVENPTGIGGFSAFIDLDAIIQDEFQMVTRYRDMTLQPEVDQGVNHIVNDAIINEPGKPSVTINLDQTKLSSNIKKKILERFDHVCKLLDLNNQAYDIFRRWYIDGRLYYLVEIDEANKKKGITGLEYIDPRQIKKIREYKINQTDNKNNIPEIEILDEYYLYLQHGFFTAQSLNADKGMAGYGSGAGTNAFRDHQTFNVNRSAGAMGPSIRGALKFDVDNVVFVHSNLTDPSSRFVLSHLHKAIRFTNLLRMLEDAIIIYRIARAPERLAFYVDTGNLPPKDQQDHVERVMKAYRNNTTYDAITGEVRDDKRHLTMLDNYWLPRNGKTSGTEIQTIQGGQNLGQIDDLEFFQSKLYEALQVPVSRFRRADKGISLGRSNEITQDELQFNRFIQRLRNRFSALFDEILEKDLILTGILTQEEWEEVKEDIYYDFNSDSYFAELKESEILEHRFRILRDLKEYEGELISRKYLQKKILKMTDEEIEEMQKEIDEEKTVINQEKIEDAELASEINSIINVEELPKLSADDKVDSKDNELDKSLNKTKQISNTDIET